MKKINLLVVACFCFSGLISGCFHDENANENTVLPGPVINKKAASALHKSTNCDEFKGYLAQNLIEQYLDNNGGSWGWCPNCRGVMTGDLIAIPEAGVTAGGGATSADSSTPGSVTGTNVQEVGVDELDVLKTDASGNIFIAQDKNLIIADAFPPEDINELSRLRFENPLSGLFLDEENKRLLVFSQSSEEIVKPSGSLTGFYGYYGQPIVEVTIVDVSDLTAPEVLTSLKYNGSYESARFINKRLHIVLNHWLYNIEETFATRKFYEDLDRYRTLKFLNLPGTKADEQALRESLALLIQQGVNTLAIENVFPFFQKDEQTKTALLQCTDVYHPEVSLKSAGMLSVISMDSDGSNMNVSSILSSGGMVYSSLNALYVVQNSYGWWQSGDEQQTVVHKFTLDDTGTVYNASGTISGVVNNSFNLSEHQNNLRVATTETIWPEDAIQPVRHNNLFILEENPTSGLDIIGSYTKFAPGETIYSSRFLGNKGFIVTFRQVDPLFAFDLSDPTNPVLKSELKIPGFSTYMHPIGKNHLLTIGRAATDAGRVEETQIQIFDISDMSNIKKAFDHIPDLLKNNSGYGYSLAEYDHHAFTYSDANNILAIPLSYYNWQQNVSFAGIATFKINVETGITENGVVDHSDFIDASECNKVIGSTSPVWDTSCVEYQYSWFAQPNRSVIMTNQSGDNNYLYSVSRLGIKANDLMNMETVLGSLPMVTNN